MSDRNNSSLDNIPVELVLVGLIVAICAVVGYFFPITYKGPWALFRIVEISIVTFLPILPFDKHAELTDILNVLKERPWDSLNYSGMRNVDATMLPVTGWFYIASMVFVVWFFRIRKPTYKKHLDYEGLLDELSKYYRFARCMIKLNPIKDMKEIDITKGDFRVREAPTYYMAKIGAVKQLKVPGSRKPFLYIDKEVAHSKMISQLGRRHRDWSSYTDYERWLIAAFMCFICSKKFGDDLQHEGEMILGDASYYFNDEMPYEKVNERVNSVIEKHANNELIRNISRSHAYTTGVIRELFHISKTRGIHPAFHFSWLYTVDRTLAMLLNETGMPDERGGGIEIGPPESCIESFYPRIHWFNEKRAKTRFIGPVTKYALDDIEEYLCDFFDFKRKDELPDLIEQVGKENEMTLSPDELAKIIAL